MLELNFERSQMRPTDQGLEGTNSEAIVSVPGTGNALVNFLSPHARDLLLRRCEPIRLTTKQVLQERGLPLQYAFFVESGAASLTTRAGDCPPVEIHTLGRGDFVGIPLVLGMRVSPHRCTVNVPGRALRLRSEALIDLIKTNVEIEKLLLRYVQATLTHSAQLVACNSRHSLSQRLARWLLVARDRIGSSEIALTHRCMSHALGVRRAGVTAAIGDMEASGLIRRSRGRVVIVDEPGLEEASCNCFRVIRSAHENSLSAPVAVRVVHP